jgi:hypothetical protein
MKWLDRVIGKHPAPLTNTGGQNITSAKEANSKPLINHVKGMFVCSANHRETKALFLVDSKGNVAAELARPSAGERFGHFAVSPDARWVTYTCHVPRREDHDAYPTIRAVPAAGGNSHEIEGWDPRYETCYQNRSSRPRGRQ